MTLLILYFGRVGELVGVPLLNTFCIFFKVRSAILCLVSFWSFWGSAGWQHPAERKSVGMFCGTCYTRPVLGRGLLCASLSPQGVQILV